MNPEYPKAEQEIMDMGTFHTQIIYWKRFAVVCAVNVYANLSYPGLLESFFINLS